MDKNLSSKIIKWLKDPEYQSGLALLVQVCRNRILVRNLSRKNTPKNLAKITWELRKAVNSQKGPGISTAATKKKSHSSPDGSSASSADEKPVKTYPETINKLIAIIGDLNSERDKLHRSLKEIPETNSRENIEKRLPVIDKIKDISDDLEVYHEIKNRFFTEKTIPTEDDLIIKKPSPGKPNAKKPDHVAQMSEAELIKRLHQLRSNLSKKKNKLLYQSVSKKKEKNPMPEGPSKDHLQQQIKTDILTIRKINKRLDDINKAK